MTEQNTILNIVKILTIWLSPLILIAGSLLLLLSRNKYSSLEQELGKEIGGIKKKIIPLLENNINSLQQWLLQNKNIAAIIFIICFFAISYFLISLH